MTASGGPPSDPEDPAGDGRDAAGEDREERAGDGRNAAEEHPLGGLWDGERTPRGYSSPPDAPSTSRPDRRGAERPPRDPVRTTIRGLGQLLITAGVVVLLFVVYEIWVTNLFGQQRQAAATQALDQLWASDSAVVTAAGQAVVTQSGGTVVVTAPTQPTTAPADRQRHYDTTEGVGFAKMYVPSFGADFVLTIIEGTSEADLYAGPGHYQGTQYPGEPGNFALAGHRVNKGAPFDDLGLLHSCDAIVVETRDDWFVYRVLPMQDEVDSWA
ncbi:MAG TPA: class E sortase, partial [Nakamurella sp.]|nr:class E sortase [Nakamurella sp.]